MKNLDKKPSTILESLLEDIVDAEKVSKDIINTLKKELPKEVSNDVSFELTKGTKSPMLVYKKPKLAFIAYFKPAKTGDVLSNDSPVRLEVTVNFFRSRNKDVEIKEFSAPRAKTYDSKEEAIDVFVKWVNKNKKKILQ